VPSERVVVVVVAEQHRGFWARELTDVPPANIVVQPRNRGTAAGVLLPLLSIYLRRDPMARFLVLPSDHYVADEAELKGALVDAIRNTQPDDRRVLLLGMTPSGFDPEYGWMLPALADGRGPRAICRFVEKPDRETAEDLMRRGALLNAFIFVAPAKALLLLFERTHPRMLGMLSRCVREGMERARLERLYEALPTADFSRDVLQPSTRWLSVTAVPDCGWSDLGTPARIQLYLSGLGRRPDGRFGAERSRSAEAEAC
jgi:mannose-1-phosphate guanylyltransferase